MSKSKVYRDISGTSDLKFREIIDLYLRVHSELDQQGVLKWKNRQQEINDAVRESLGNQIKGVINDYK